MLKKTPLKKKIKKKKIITARKDLKIYKIAFKSKMLNTELPF